MKTIKKAMGIVLLSMIAVSCSKSSNSKILFEEDFSKGHADWKVVGDTIIKQFDLQFQNSKEPLKVSWLASKDAGGCLQVSYARIERINADSNMKVDSIKAQSGTCGTEWESSDSIQYNQMVFTGILSKSHTVRKNVKQGTFLIINGNGKITDL